MTVAKEDLVKRGEYEQKVWSVLRASIPSQDEIAAWSAAHELIDTYARIGAEQLEKLRSEIKEPGKAKNVGKKKSVKKSSSRKPVKKPRP